MRGIRNWKDVFLPKMNVPIIISVIACFVLIDLLVVPKVISHKISATADFRLPTNFTYGELKAFVDLINQDPAPKVILTGDSIIQGGGVKSGDSSIAAFLQDRVGGLAAAYHVYNLGVSGAAPGDCYFILKALKLTDRDIVVYNFNMGHYGVKPVTFPDKTAELTSKYHNGRPLYPMLQLRNNDKIENTLQLWVTNTWKLYAYREVIKDVLWGDDREEPEVNLLPWTETDWTEKTKNTPKRGSNHLLDTDPAMIFTNFLVAGVKQTEARLLVFNTPLNQEMMQQYDMMDRDQYDRNIQEIRKKLDKAGVVFKDYETIIPSAYFTDSLHPMKEGNEIIAQKLKEDLSGWMQGEGAAE